MMLHLTQELEPPANSARFNPNGLSENICDLFAQPHLELKGEIVGPAERSQKLLRDRLRNQYILRATRHASKGCYDDQSDQDGN